MGPGDPTGPGDRKGSGDTLGPPWAPARRPGDRKSSGDTMGPHGLLRPRGEQLLGNCRVI